MVEFYAQSDGVKANDEMHKVHLFSAGEHDSRVGLIRLAIMLLFPTLLAAAQTVPAAPETGPLIVDRNSRVVVMEYEKWFAPKGVTFQGGAAMPLLQSADMRPALVAMTAPTPQSAKDSLPGWNPLELTRPWLR